MITAWFVLQSSFFPDFFASLYNSFDKNQVRNDEFSRIGVFSCIWVLWCQQITERNLLIELQSSSICFRMVQRFSEARLPWINPKLIQLLGFASREILGTASIIRATSFHLFKRPPLSASSTSSAPLKNVTNTTGSEIRITSADIN